MNRSTRLALFVATSLCLLSDPVAAQETLGVLSLDGLSFVSFEDLEVLAIPSGATITFRFGDASGDGSVAFAIHPEDVSIPPMPLRSSEGTLKYGLAAPASGVMRIAGGTATIDFMATVRVTLTGPTGAGSATYPMHFTTEQTTAINLTGTKVLTVEGEDVVRSAGYVQLVAGTTNKTQAFPEPGKAVYTVLSGTFDRLPGAP